MGGQPTLATRTPKWSSTPGTGAEQGHPWPNYSLLMDLTPTPFLPWPPAFSFLFLKLVGSSGKMKV